MKGSVNARLQSLDAQLTTRFKLSRNKSDADRASVIEHLREGSQINRALAYLMAQSPAS